MADFENNALLVTCKNMSWAIVPAVSEAVLREAGELKISPIDVIHAALVDWLANNLGRTRR